jgi:hypothetical protein
VAGEGERLPRRRQGGRPEREEPVKERTILPGKHSHYLGDIRCFWVEFAHKLHRQLRRYSLKRLRETGDLARPCAVAGIHQAHTHLDYVPVADFNDPLRCSGDIHPHSDPRWPTLCDACGYVFQDDDGWQVWVDDVYRDPITGEECDLEKAPNGAMWDAWWLREHDWFGEDGIALMIQTPAGEWAVDKPVETGAGAGTPWHREGIPSTGLVTASPSILIGRPSRGRLFHAFLNDGVLERLPDSTI